MNPSALGKRIQLIGATLESIKVDRYSATETAGLKIT
jgi:hypothetical protein